MFYRNKNPVIIVLFVVCLLFFVILAGGCAEKNTGEQAPPVAELNGVSEAVEQAKKPETVKVVTTIFPLADIIRQVGGEGVEVTSLLVAGASPHTYEPSVEQAKAVAVADLVIYIGGGLDDWVIKLAEGTRQARLLGIMDQMEGLLLDYDPLHLAHENESSCSHDHQHVHSHAHDNKCSHAHDNGHSQEHSCDHEPACSHAHDREHDQTAEGEKEPCHQHGPHDPHIWLDPLLVRDLVAPLVQQELTLVNSEWEGVFQENLAGFQQALTQLHAEITGLVGRFEQKRFISYHSAWNYYARRYGLEEVAAVEVFPGKEPSARWMAELVKLAAQYEINVLFAEPQLGGNTAAVIAREIGGKVLLLDPLGGEATPDRNDYFSLLRYNTYKLATALGPGNPK